MTDKKRIPEQAWKKIIEFQTEGQEKYQGALEAQQTLIEAQKALSLANEKYANYVRGIADAFGVELDKVRIVDGEFVPLTEEELKAIAEAKEAQEAKLEESATPSATQPDIEAVKPEVFEEDDMIAHV